jgi:hypothetical protein
MPAQAPYCNNGSLSQEQAYFNRVLSKVRVAIEHTFGLLKGRWRCLQIGLHCEVEMAPQIIHAACILHNICQRQGYAFGEDEK